MLVYGDKEKVIGVTTNKTTPDIYTLNPVDKNKYFVNSIVHCVSLNQSTFISVSWDKNYKSEYIEWKVDNTTKSFQVVGTIQSKTEIDKIDKAIHSKMPYQNCILDQKRNFF